ncbi:VOC family protein [Streptomyces sp. NPDC052299]|uniref:bleomycin resistance protein n=1 Tax=Streptomyces sp. NPDC052299 TaxID=3155054 RepID=UPI0034417B84
MSETTIPILPCRTIRPVLDFYAALGFEATFRQTSPNPYAVVERGGIQLHFFGVKRHDPAASYSTCYIRTDDVDALYSSFRSSLKAAYGRVPTRGFPRVGPLKDTSYGARQFLVTDPAGNCLRIGQQTGRDQHHRPAPEETFARALHHASLFADSKNDPAAAARIIDRVLGLDAESPTPVQLLRLLVLRADAAGRLGDDATAASALARAAALPLTAQERESARDDLERLQELRD